MIGTQLKLAIFRETLCQSLQDCLFIPTRSTPTPSQGSTVTGTLNTGSQYFKSVCAFLSDFYRFLVIKQFMKRNMFPHYLLMSCNCKCLYCK